MQSEAMMPSRGPGGQAAIRSRDATRFRTSADSKQAIHFVSISVLTTWDERLQRGPRAQDRVVAL